jgi:hypothetical protein
MRILNAQISGILEFMAYLFFTETHFRMRTILWKLMVQCGALNRLVEVMDSSSAENDDLRKYVPTGLILLAVALNVPKPCCPTQRTRKHEDNCPDQLDETASGNSTISSDTKVKKWLPLCSIMNYLGTFCVMAPL